jgi:hypothetical protein
VGGDLPGPALGLPSSARRVDGADRADGADCADRADGADGAAGADRDDGAVDLEPLPLAVHVQSRVYCLQHTHCTREAGARECDHGIHDVERKHKG